MYKNQQNEVRQHEEINANVTKKLGLHHQGNSSVLCKTHKRISAEVSPKEFQQSFTDLGNPRSTYLGF